MDLDDDVNATDVRKSLDKGQLIGIVSEEKGGIIAYAIGQEHADLIARALDTDDSISIKTLKAMAKSLVDDGFNYEYTRGICELIGDADGIADVPLDERSYQICEELGLETDLTEIDSSHKKLREKLEGITNQLATVKSWCEIPEETEAGINGVLDELNKYCIG